MSQLPSASILNPNIYLNYLSPDAARRFELARDASLVTLGALLCDMLISLPEDLDIMKSGIGPTTIAYILCRTSGLVYVLLSVILKISPESNCAKWQLGTGLCWVAATAAFSFLFLRRAHAVFHNRRLWRHFYSLLFISNVAVSVVVPIGSHAGPLGQTGRCINTGIERYVSAAVFSRLLFDSCVFLGTSYELAAAQRLNGVETTWRTFVTPGKVSTHLVSALLRGGQRYYLVSVCSNLIMTFLIVSPHISLTYEVMFTVPDIALSTAMACRVYRNLRRSANHTEITMSMSTPLEFPSSDSGNNTANVDLSSHPTRSRSESCCLNTNQASRC